MERDSRGQMTRISAVNGYIEFDPNGTAGGRGGYLHSRLECVEKFKSSRIRQFRSLGRAISLDERRRIAELIRTRLDSK
jgi:predicted RNA-binding protein YlxR (DUF448 family)